MLNSLPNNNLNPLNTLRYTQHFLNFKQSILLLLQTPLHLGYRYYFSDILNLWLVNKQKIQYFKKFMFYWQSEMLLQFFSRNVSIIVYTPKIYSIVDKKHICSLDLWQNWQNTVCSTLLFGFSTGRCGFKSHETQSFVAADTLIRAFLWFLQRFNKKLSPIKINFFGDNKKFLRYFNRLNPQKNMQKTLNYNFFSFNDVTPVPFNGCRFMRTPRKRYRKHEHKYKTIVQYIKKFSYKSKF